MLCLNYASWEDEILRMPKCIKSLVSLTNNLNAGEAANRGHFSHKNCLIIGPERLK